VVVTQ
jgi:hypothetical protein